MSQDSLSQPVDKASTAVAPQRGRWRRRLKWAAVTTLAMLLIAGYLVKDHVRTLASLRRVPGTNAYVMDYYVDYHIDQILDRGMDISNIRDSCVSALCPNLVEPIARRIASAYLPRKFEALAEPGHHCSTVALQSKDGQVYFGRNFDFYNDACLILRVHDRDGLASIAVVDIAYLNLNRGDLDEISLLARIPLLFAPYYLMDGMNRHGVAVSDMSVNAANPPRSPDKPSVIQATLMRLILDYAKTADEAVELIRKYNVHFVVVPEHLMIADAAGNFRVVEYLDGKIRVTTPEQPWQVCTNHTLWQRSEQENDERSKRYRVGSAAAEELSGVVDLDAARGVVRSMFVDRWTMWTSLYNLTNGEARVIYRSAVDSEYRDVVPRDVILMTP